MEVIFPFLHDMASMEKSRFLGSEAQRPCSKSAYLQRANSSPVSPTPVPSSMELYGPRAPLGSQQKIHHIIQLANSFQTSARITPGICGEKPKEEPGQGL